MKASSPFLLHPERAHLLIEQFKSHKILVVGDLMLDEFLWGRATRIAPEAPVPVVEIERETVHLGGAGNVAANLAELSASATVIGVVGRDSACIKLQEEFAKAGIETSGIVEDLSRPTTVKTRVIAHSQHVVRTDREKKTAVNDKIEWQLAENFTQLLKSVEAIIISDYQKGVITPTLLKKILPRAVEQNIPICIDPKLKNFECYQPATIITPNQHEAETAVRFNIDSPETLQAAGSKLRSILGGATVLITRGENGMSLFDDQYQTTHIPAVAREVYDVTGAGDTVIATVALALASGASKLEAAILANHAAGIVVGKVGTATAKPEEILSSVEVAYRSAK